MSKRAADRKGPHILEVHAATLCADARTQHITERTLGVIRDADVLIEIAAQRANMAAELGQGFQLEQLEVVKFNLDALRKNSALKAATTDSLGMTNHETSDVIISRGKRQLKQFQLKSGGNASRSAFMLSDPKYKNVGLVGPSDQEAEIQRLYQQRIKTGTLKADDYSSASKRLRKGVAAENVSSGGTTYDEALEATTAKGAEKMAGSFGRKAMLSEAHQSGLEAARIGGAIAGGVSGVSGLIRLARGEADAGEIVAQVTVDAAKGYAISYASGAISKASTHAVRAGFAKMGGAALGETVSARFAQSNAHVALAAGIVQSGKSLVRYLHGEIDETELMSEVSHTAMTGASAFYYGALGQALIPVPVLGAFVGSTVGYFVGNMLHQSGLISLGETATVKIARERRERVEAICMTAIPLMRAHRIELDQLIEAHFAKRRKKLTGAFDQLESAMIAWNGDNFLASLQQVNEEFGSTLPFKSQKEFDAMMLDDDQVFVL
ncbi:hypothetical protein SAMN05216319_2785 [Duganella sp. CF402]|uniref:hypothetical protein n=1 Tax=unclassified Duganella TaxID=2636909 RepID=UPI0008B012DB|nr:MULTISPECIES: hypothetical protein [unclassified Duganella]RZT08799.1 hypothetical protein EV582_0836 [Duganella sp. BK701]SEL81537.1 hypothetical protein SAMN05216319_2785 [Duganella sp. CF402]